MTVHRITSDDNIIRVASRNQVIKIYQGRAGTPGAPGVVQSIVAGSNITVDDTDPANPVVSVYETQRNYTGQVRVNYTGVTMVNFTDGVSKVVPIQSGTPTISSSPTTIWPVGSDENYDPDFFDIENTRLKENLREGQLHTWRVVGTYANKAPSNNGALIVELYNPDSGFVLTESTTLPDGTTSGAFTDNFITIADNQSIPDGRGYRLRVKTTFSDNNLTVSISSITRISAAMEHQ